MRTIFKYHLPLIDSSYVHLPNGAEILSCQEQFGALQIWALVDPEYIPISRKIWMSGTGHPVPDIKLQYISTVITSGGTLVWHIFEEVE